MLQRLDVFGPGDKLINNHWLGYLYCTVDSKFEVIVLEEYGFEREGEVAGKLNGERERERGRS